MKQVLTSAGVLALGAASLCALDPEMTRQSTGGPFTLSGTVRGFYDDNIYTSPTDDTRTDSFGYQVIPSVHLNLPFEQTFLSLGYIYTLTWYDKREPRNIDQAHEVSAKFRHQFSPRQQIAVTDSFVFTSEPTIADRSGGIITSPVRTESSVYHNYGDIDYTLGLTRTLGLNLGYGNHWYDYNSEGDFSRSALLDRFEHLIRADLTYLFTPKLVGVLGYNYGFTTFEGDDLIAGDDPATPGVDESLESDSRDSRTHTAYVGADYDVTAKLRASGRVGAQFTDHYKADQDSANPYVDISLSYRIRSSTSVEAGFRHARNATDVSRTDASGQPTLDAETSVAYLQFNHQITRKLSASILGQYQYSVFNDGFEDDESEYLWMVGVNLAYTFNRHFSAEAGYNYDQLRSGVDSADRSYDRNRYYIGLTARY